MKNCLCRLVIRIEDKSPQTFRTEMLRDQLTRLQLSLPNRLVARQRRLDVLCIFTAHVTLVLVVAVSVPVVGALIGCAAEFGASLQLVSSDFQDRPPTSVYGELSSKLTHLPNDLSEVAGIGIAYWVIVSV